MQPSTFTEPALRSLRARALRQALGYTTKEFSELTGISYGSITQWGFPDKGSLSVSSCHKIISALDKKGVKVTLEFLQAGEMRDLTSGLAGNVEKILRTGEKLTDKQAANLLE